MAHSSDRATEDRLVSRQAWNQSLLRSWYHKDWDQGLHRTGTIEMEQDKMKTAMQDSELS